ARPSRRMSWKPWGISCRWRYALRREGTAGRDNSSRHAHRAVPRTGGRREIIGNSPGTRRAQGNPVEGSEDVMRLEVTWNGKMKFVAEAGRHSAEMDAPLPFGSDEALTPKHLLLASICGCTAMDVVALL